MIGEAFTYLSAHPALAGVLLLTIVLAGVGLWYVMHNHFQAILVTLLCGAGLLSGFVVLYRGAEAEMRDLIVIGLFLVAAFPVIYLLSVRTHKKVTAPPSYPGIRLPGQAHSASPPQKHG